MSERVDILIRAKDAFSRVFSGARAAASKLAAGVQAGYKGMVRGVKVAAKAVAGIGAALIGPIALAAKRQQDILSFEALLGSAEEAKKVVGELAELSAASQIDTGPILNASKTLHLLTGNAYGSAESLKALVGVSVATGANIEDLADVYGRFIQKLLIGDKAVSEEIKRMSQLGIAQIDTVKAIKQMVAAGAPLDKIMILLANDMARYNDQIKKAADQTSGLYSTLKGNLMEAMIDFGTQILPTAERALRYLIAKIDELRKSGALQEWGQKVAAVFNTVYSLAKDLFSEDFEIKFRAVQDLKVIGAAIGNGALEVLKDGAVAIGYLIGEGFKVAIKQMFHDPKLLALVNPAAAVGTVGFKRLTNKVAAVRENFSHRAATGRFMSPEEKAIAAEERKKKREREHTQRMFKNVGNVDLDAIIGQAANRTVEDVFNERGQIPNPLNSSVVTPQSPTGTTPSSMDHTNQILEDIKVAIEMQAQPEGV